MAKPHERYRDVVVESFRIGGSGLHGDVHIRPIAGQGFGNYPVDIPSHMI
jgi:hypothetical protein